VFHCKNAANGALQRLAFSAHCKRLRSPAAPRRTDLEKPGITGPRPDIVPATI
jgi:hypothetical protein